ncbi:ABC transporter permease family protein [Arthrobacter dokdonensis]|uniref:hypothetical protein n=1 Tax=Arthrobacter dokdonellae TaxID=2211210 RepID=UPI00188238BB|nr:hypothetical protein [Arthrobacter dokdonellae]
MAIIVLAGLVMLPGDVYEALHPQLMALSINSSNDFRTIPVGIALFGSPHITPYGTLFAASTVVVLPIAILVLVFRKSVLSALTSGAVKG